MKRCGRQCSSYSTPREGFLRMRKRLSVWVGASFLLALTFAMLASASSLVSTSKSVSPTAEQLAGVPAGDTLPGTDWPMFQGNYALTGFSTLTQINTRNVSGLHQVWSASFDPPGTGNLEGTPIVVSGKGKNLPLESGTMFYPSNLGLYALNAATGETLWHYSGPTTTFNGSAGRIGGVAG